MTYQRTCFAVSNADKFVDRNSINRGRVINALACNARGDGFAMNHYNDYLTKQYTHAYTSTLHTPQTVAST